MVKFFGKEDSSNTNEEQEQSNLTLIKGKVAEKGLKSFLRCGTKFTDQFQELKVDNKTLNILKKEKKLTIQELN